MIKINTKQNDKDVTTEFLKLSAMTTEQLKSSGLEARFADLFRSFGGNTQVLESNVTIPGPIYAIPTTEEHFLPTSLMSNSPKSVQLTQEHRAVDSQPVLVQMPQITMMPDSPLTAQVEKSTDKVVVLDDKTESTILSENVSTTERGGDQSEIMTSDNNVKPKDDGILKISHVAMYAKALISDSDSSEDWGGDSVQGDNVVVLDLHANSNRSSKDEQSAFDTDTFKVR